MTKRTKPRQAGSKSWLDKHQRELGKIRSDLWRLWVRLDRLYQSSLVAERR